MEQRDRGFKEKTIVSIITNKMNAWIRTIDDELLQERIQRSYILTGGAIASMLMGQLPNDFDVYFDDVDICAGVAQYYVNRHKTAKNEESHYRIVVLKHPNRVEILIKSAGVLGDEVDNDSYQYFETVPEESVSEEIDNFLGNPSAETISEEKGRYRAAFITSNAISLTDNVQIITRFVGDAAKIHENFDYVHATNYYSKKTGLVLNMEAMKAIMAKELTYVGSLYPIASLFRMRKFLGRGWTINVGEILKISWDISKLDLTDFNVLKEQLTGVDVAYFNELLRLMKTENRELDRSYLVELINRIF
jgi:hypothetical protein